MNIIFRKEESVYVVRQSKVITKFTHIERHASENHITQSNLVSGHMEPLSLVKLFTFSQSERQKFDFLRQSSVKATIVPDYIIQHPARGRSTDNEYNISLTVSPGVPEIAQFRNQL